MLNVCTTTSRQSLSPMWHGLCTVSINKYWTKRVYSDSRDRRHLLNNKFQLLVNCHFQQWHELQHPLIIGNATEHSMGLRSHT